MPSLWIDHLEYLVIAVRLRSRLAMEEEKGNECRGKLNSTEERVGELALLQERLKRLGEELAAQRRGWGTLGSSTYDLQ